MFNDYWLLRNVILLLILVVLLYDIIFSSVKYFCLVIFVLKMLIGFGYKENEVFLLWFCR